MNPKLQRQLLRALSIFGLLIPVGPARAWVYPEHRDIAVLSVQRLDAEHRAAFDRLWHDAREGAEPRLCEQGADAGQGLAPACIDWAALSAIAGDHACSSKEMVDTAVGSAWILGVADVAAQLKVDLARIPVVPAADSEDNDPDLVKLIPDLRRRVLNETLRAEKLNALRTADTRMQRTDPGYATRAGSNNAHFLLPRPRIEVDEATYGMLATNPGAELNAVGVYTVYHLSALQKATRLANEALASGERQALARAALADEAFALHFLQDTFAAGHVAGTWGDASQRKGTHDHYNENGLEIFTWSRNGGSFIIMGDAHMRPEDAQLAARAVRKSLEQVLDVATGHLKAEMPHSPGAPAEADGFDVCRSKVFPTRTEGLRVMRSEQPLFAEVLAPTPVPGLGAGLGAMPRFRSELGPFIGLAGSIDLRQLDGGFESSQMSKGHMAGLDLSLRVGVGLDGVIGDSGDGLVFASIGLRADAASSNRFLSTLDSSDVGGGLLSAVPARSGLSLRFRAPFFLVPGDLLLMSPLYFVSPETYTAMAVTASNGGYIPWQLGWATSIGRFQFVLGRELGITTFGRKTNDQLLMPGASAGDRVRLVQLNSTLYDLPILEYRPYRSFSGNQSSSVIFQLFSSADVPGSHKLISPAGGPDVNLNTIWSIGLRMVFDWRYYR